MSIKCIRKANTTAGPCRKPTWSVQRKAERAILNLSVRNKRTLEPRYDRGSHVIFPPVARKFFGHQKKRSSCILLIYLTQKTRKGDSNGGRKAIVIHSLRGLCLRAEDPRCFESKRLTEFLDGMLVLCETDISITLLMSNT